MQLILTYLTQDYVTHSVKVVLNIQDDYKKTIPTFGPLTTPRQKSIRALEIVLAIFLCFECQFLSFYACYKEYKA